MPMGRVSKGLEKDAHFRADVSCLQEAHADSEVYIAVFDRMSIVCEC